MNKKRLVIISLVVIVLLSLVGVYLYTNNQQDSSEPQSSISPGPIDAPIPDGVLNITREDRYEYTDAIISPNAIANDPNAYTEKTITTRGWVTEISPGEYLILSINSDEPYGLQLASNVGIEFKNYVDPPVDPTKESKPVTLTGELTTSGDNGSLVLLVSNLTE